MRALFAFLLFPLAVLATISLPDITKETFVGTWEAVMPTEESGIATAVYRMEIAATGDSYLIAVFAGPDVPQAIQFACRLKTVEITKGDLTLHFRTLDPEADEIVFRGSGVSQGELGAIHGKFMTAAGKPLNLFNVEIWFHKGSWTRQFEDASKKAEKHIEELRHPQRPSQVPQR